MFGTQYNSKLKGSWAKLRVECFLRVKRAGKLLLRIGWSTPSMSRIVVMAARNHGRKPPWELNKCECGCVKGKVW